MRAIDAAPGYELVAFPKSHPRMAAPWSFIGPEALYWGPRHLVKLWNVKDIYITENGCAAADEPAADGVAHDVDRIMFLRNSLTQLRRATAEGAPVRGYFHWSLMDNFEWASGYGLRFGLVRVDYATLKRTPKLSAGVFQGGGGSEPGSVTRVTDFWRALSAHGRRHPSPSCGEGGRRAGR